MSYPNRPVPTSIEGALEEYAVREAKRQDFLRWVAVVVRLTPGMPEDPLPFTFPLPEWPATKRYLMGVDQVLRDAARQ